MESPIIAKLPRGHRMDRQFGVVYEHSPVHADDLTRIEGIRTREAVLLNQLGVYCFGQIALWRHREMVEIAGELQVPVARIVDEAWIDQARALSHTAGSAPTRDLPASILRTVSLLACALLVGVLTIYLLGHHRNQALTGILSADITSIRVPAPSRLTAVHVKPGQEVFSGQPLLTLEKLEHLALIESQERSVRTLDQELKRAEAQARIEVEWRTRDLDRELSGMRLQIAEKGRGVRWQNSELTASAFGGPSRSSISPISSRNMFATSLNFSPAGALMFFSGSGQTSPEPVVLSLRSRPVRVAEAPREGVMSDSPALSSAEPVTSHPTELDPQLDSLMSEQVRLESVRESFPATVREAMGVSSLKDQYSEAAQRLESLKSVSREISVQAPVYGIVGQVRYRQGDNLPSGEIMLRILHTDRRYIMVHLPTRRVLEMEPGQEVELIFPGNQEFRGQIVDVPMLADATGQSGDTQAAVRIEPIGRLWPMVPVGSQVDVVSLR